MLKNCPPQQYFFKKGDRVIAFGNEWGNMVIGEVIGCLEDYIGPGKNGSNIPVVKDWITGKELCCMGVKVRFCWDYLEQLCHMNPYERWNYYCPWVAVEENKPKRAFANMKFEDYMKKILSSI